MIRSDHETTLERVRELETELERVRARTTELEWELRLLERAAPPDAELERQRAKTAELERQVAIQRQLNIQQPTAPLARRRSNTAESVVVVVFGLLLISGIEVPFVRNVIRAFYF